MKINFSIFIILRRKFFLFLIIFFSCSGKPKENVRKVSSNQIEKILNIASTKDTKEENFLEEDIKEFEDDDNNSLFLSDIIIEKNTWCIRRSKYTTYILGYVWNTTYTPKKVYMRVILNCGVKKKIFIKPIYIILPMQKNIFESLLDSEEYNLTEECFLEDVMVEKVEEAEDRGESNIELWVIKDKYIEEAGRTFVDIGIKNKNNKMVSFSFTVVFEDENGIIKGIGYDIKYEVGPSEESERVVSGPYYDVRPYKKIIPFIERVFPPDCC